MAIPKALNLAGTQQGVEVEAEWVHTSTITRVDAQFAGFEGIWCVPASPYANTMGALATIRYARERGLPFLGTCGGFQHALLEYARNVFGMPEAEHAETDPGAPLRLIARSPVRGGAERRDPGRKVDACRAYGQARSRGPPQLRSQSSMNRVSFDALQATAAIGTAGARCGAYRVSF